jgi:hypothetical protein
MRSLRELAMHPAANFVISKALERANAAQLSYALHKLLDSLGKLRRMFAFHILSCRCSSSFKYSGRDLGTLIERAIALNVLEDEICEVTGSLYHVWSMQS